MVAIDGAQDLESTLQEIEGGADPADLFAARSCAGEDVVLFFGPPGERREAREARELRAKQVCSRCPRHVRCLTEALEGNEHGIWGGTTEEERAELRGLAVEGAISGRSEAVA